MSPTSAVTPSVAGLLARRVDVVGEHDPARVAGQQRDLARRQRRPEAGDDVVEAGLVGHQGVGVALDDDRLARLADRALGLVDEVQRPALVEERRRRGVQVLRSVALEQPAAHPDGVAVLVADREDDARAELVVDAAAAVWRGRGEADLDELLGPHVALGAERPGHLVPAARRPAELVGLDGLVGEAAAVEVLERGLAGRSSRSGPRGRRRSRCRAPRAGAPCGRPRAWSARRSRRRRARRASGAPRGRSRCRAA